MQGASFLIDQKLTPPRYHHRKESRPSSDAEASILNRPSTRLVQEQDTSTSQATPMGEARAERLYNFLGKSYLLFSFLLRRFPHTRYRHKYCLFTHTST